MYPEKTTDLSMTSFITYVVSSTPNVLKNLTTSKMLMKIGVLRYLTCHLTLVFNKHVALI